MDAGTKRDGEELQDYLGDGVYASWDGYQIWLRADRDCQTHEIAIESPVFSALLRYKNRIVKHFADQTAATGAQPE